MCLYTSQLTLPPLNYTAWWQRLMYAWAACQWSYPCSFRGGRVGTPLSSLKCFRTHYGRHCEPFSGHKCTRLQDFACTVSNIFKRKRPPVLGPRHQFPLGSPAFPLFLFYETTTGLYSMTAWGEIRTRDLLWAQVQRDQYSADSTCQKKKQLIAEIKDQSTLVFNLSNRQLFFFWHGWSCLTASSVDRAIFWPPDCVYSRL